MVYIRPSPLRPPSRPAACPVPKPSPSLAAKIGELPDVRADLVARVKAEIENGTYETPERVEITVNRLMEELFPEA